MKDVAGHGRTILFVSHNMAALLSLCTKSVWFNNGRLVGCGETREIVDHYISQGEVNQSNDIDLSKLPRSGDLGAKLSIEKIEWISKLPLKNGDSFALRIFFKTKCSVENVAIGIGFNSTQGTRLLSFDTDLINTDRPAFLEEALCFVDLSVKENSLAPGIYSLDIGARSGDNYLLDFLPSFIQIEIAIGKKTPAIIAHHAGSGVRMGGDWTWHNSSH